MSKTELFAVTGKPVGHSLSPYLFGRLFGAFGRTAVYSRLAADSSREAIEIARAIGIRGLNVTSPYKEEMRSLVKADAHAGRIGAVNCVMLDGGGPDPRADRGAESRAISSGVGYNTDFIGLAGALEAAGVASEGRAALVLGTGGAGRAAAYGLVRAGAARVVLAGRSLDRARAAAKSLGCEAARLDDIERIIDGADLCVSCLPFPASRILARPLRDGTIVVDAHYAGRVLKDGGGRYSTALSWLFHQAIPSFEIFTGLGVKPIIRKKIWADFMTHEPQRKPHIALVGFMGTGKTAAGLELARLIGSEFADTDEAVEASAGTAVPDIIRTRGESAFRALEKSALENIATADGPRRVISAGGGAVLDPDNRRVLARNCRVVWLWAAARTVLSRIDVRTRPVLDHDRPLESAEQALAARIPFYASVSDLIVSSESREPLETARRIKDEMDQTV